jgi:hypothetical protein
MDTWCRRISYPRPDHDRWELTWGFIFVLIGLNIMDMRSKKETNTFNILFYLIVYLSIYPAIMITSLYKKIVGKYSWGR